MNVRKNIDYSTMFAALDAAMRTEMSQMERNYKLGRIVCTRSEKGAAVAAAEYLSHHYQHVPGLSPRNLRRMRDFCRLYEREPELLALAMEIGWTQNVVILEADLNMGERRWYLQAVRQFGWTKAELQEKIASSAHLEIQLDEPAVSCYTRPRNEQSRADQICNRKHGKIQQFDLTIGVQYVVRICWKRNGQLVHRRCRCGLEKSSGNLAMTA